MTTWSNHQQAIFDFVADADAGSAVVEAVAGSGKTTTIVEAMKYLPRGVSVGFMAFNKSIAEELGRRVPDGVVCKTLNGLGHGAVMANVQNRVKLDANKVRGIAREVVPEDSQRMDPELVGNVCKVVSLAKAHALKSDDLDGMMDLAAHHALDVGGNEVVYAGKVLKLSTMDTRVIDFDDQLYLPVMNGWYPRSRFDVLFVDEAQDVSAVQRQLIAMAVKPGGRVIAVGDRRQAIYGFRGADSNSLDRIVEEFGATRLPLSVTYRCPTAVVALAKEYAPELEAAPQAAEGYVGNHKEGQDYDPKGIVVCRNNAPLLRLAFSLLANGKACHVMGRDIGGTLTNFIQRFKKSYVGDLLNALDKWYLAEMGKAEREENDTKAASVEDKRDCVYALSEGLGEDDSVGELVQRIKTIFAAGGGVTLSSVHRAKGLEADNVYILRPDLMPSKFARQPWQQQQEQNLMYVAFTRAGKALYFVE